MKNQHYYNIRSYNDKQQQMNTFELLKRYVFVRNKTCFAMVIVFVIIILFYLSKPAGKNDDLSGQDDRLIGENSFEMSLKSAVKQVGLDIELSGDSKKSIDKMHKLVHLDLKGSPPKVSYLKQLIPFIKENGATGLLIEYEDMFPYENSLRKVKNQNAYSKEELTEILTLAKENDLLIIPLIQTYGHLEFVLKFDEFKYLREIEKHFQVITPCIQDTYDKVLYPMIDQIIDFHMKYDLKYIHIGCDEVYHIGLNPSCSSRRLSGTAEYFTSHVTKLVKYIKSKKSDLNVIIWDDMLRGQLKSRSGPFAEFAKTVQPMVWNYHEKLRLGQEVWDAYAELFSEIWLASAFKGATFQLAIMPNTTKHYENHLDWLRLIDRMNGKIKFNGIALTGWSRYDHMQGICELLPVAIPSLVICLQTLSTYGEFDKIISKTKAATSCVDSKKTYGFPMDGILADDPSMAHECNFPGSEVYKQIVNFNIEIEKVLDKHKTYSSILNDFNLENGYVNSMIYEFSMFTFYPEAKNSIANIISQLKTTFDTIFYPDLGKEFIEIYVRPHEKTIESMYNKLRDFKLKTFYNRPYRREMP